jgi:hypothetical protein
MFKLLNGVYVNINHITKIEDGGIDPKDNKHYCRVYTSLDDKSPLYVEGTIEDVINFLTK